MFILQLEGINERGRPVGEPIKINLAVEKGKCLISERGGGVEAIQTEIPATIG